MLACTLAYYRAQTPPAQTHTCICPLPAVLGSHPHQLVFMQDAQRVNINNDAVSEGYLC